MIHLEGDFEIEVRLVGVPPETFEVEVRRAGATLLRTGGELSYSDSPSVVDWPRGVDAAVAAALSRAMDRAIGRWKVRG